MPTYTLRSTTITNQNSDIPHIVSCEICGMKIGQPAINGLYEEFCLSADKAAYFPIGADVISAIQKHETECKGESIGPVKRLGPFT